MSATQIYELELNSYSALYHEFESTGEYWYEVPVNSFVSLLDNNSDYIFTLSGQDITEYSISRKVFFVGQTTAEKIDGSVQDLNNNITFQFNELQDTMTSLGEEQKVLLQEQIELQQQQAEDNKGIIASIKEVISYLNPFSENFFVYKLIDLLIDALISLFVPSSEFFSNWIADLNEYFSDRFGLLYYPFELAINILERVSNISSGLNKGFTISFPDLELMGATLIPAYSYDFTTLLDNETFAYIYDIYLISVDVILICLLLVLCKNTFVEIFGGRFADDIASVVNSDEVSYKRYSRYQSNKERYKGG